MIKGAEISACGKYRYMLWRRWAESPATKIAVFVMLNPSTADADVDDPTIRKLIGFCKQWGMGGFIVVNAYALRATDPKELQKAQDPVGDENFRHLWKAVSCSPDVIVLGWGANPISERAMNNIKWALEGQSLTPKCLGVTKDGHPKHPLYISYKQELIDFSFRG